MPFNSFSRSAAQSSLAQGGHVSFAGKILPGLVVSVDSPKKDGAVKTRVPGIDNNIPDQYLPWAVAMETLGVGAVSGISLPVPGQKVFVYFPDSAPQVRYYLGVWQLPNANLLKFLPSYPNGYISVDAMGTTICADTKEGVYQFILPDGQGFTWRKEGGKVQAYFQDLEINAETLTLNARKSLVVNGPKISLGAKLLDLVGTTLKLGATSFSLGASKASVSAAKLDIQAMVSSQGGGGSPQEGEEKNQASDVKALTPAKPAVTGTPANKASS